MPEPTKRPLYFDRQLLAQEDLSLAQGYSVSRRRQHNRSLHTWGITEGLALSFTPGSSVATLSPGCAIDALGQEIVLAAPAQTTDVTGSAGKSVFVTISYNEVPTDPRTANGVTDNVRVTEAPVIRVTEVAPTAPSSQLIVGQLTVGADGKITAASDGVDPNRRRWAGAVGGTMIVDQQHVNSGGLLPGVIFGGAGAGEGISSKRTPGGNQYGLDFYTASGTVRMSLTNSGNVGIGTSSPNARLDVSGSGASQCCAPVPPTIALSESASGAGRRAWLQFHNGGEAEAYIRLAGAGPAGSGREGPRRLEIGDNQGVGASLTVTGSVTAGGDLAVGGKHALRGTDPWLRLNQDGAFTLGVYTPGLLASGGLNIGGQPGGNWGNPGPGSAWIAGNVAIGTTTQTSRLHVAGNAGVLSLEGTDHAYIQWYPRGAGAGRRAWTGFSGPGSNSLTLNNESPNEPNNPARMHLYTGEDLYMLPRGATRVSKAWGGTGDLLVEGRLGTMGQPATPRTPGLAGGIHTWDLEVEGSAWCRNGWASGPRDMAERFNMSPGSIVEAGDVVSFDPECDQVTLSFKASDPLVCGAVSTKPGVVLNVDPDATEDRKQVPVALCGRVPCKAVDENGPIRRGDLLTSSSTPGHAMKAPAVWVDGRAVYQAGTIIGKALTGLDRRSGLIELFVAPA